MKDDFDLIPDPVGFAKNILAEIEQAIAETPDPENDIPEIVYFAKDALKGLLENGFEGKIVYGVDDEVTKDYFCEVEFPYSEKVLPFHSGVKVRVTPIVN